MTDININAADISSMRLVAQASPPAAPDAPSGRLYLGTDDLLHVKLDDNTIIDIATGAAGASPVGCNVTRTSDQSGISNNVWTKADFNSVIYNSGAWSEANDEFTIPQAGLYLVDAGLTIYATPGYPQIAIYVNGEMYRETNKYFLINTWAQVDIKRVLWFALNDVISIYGKINSGGLFRFTAWQPLELSIWRLGG